MLAATAQAADAAAVNIADTQAYIGQFDGNHTTAVLFDPLSGPVTVTGSIDFSGFDTASTSDNNTLFVGLISKDRYDAFVAGTDTLCCNGLGSSFFGFLETAWAGFQFTDGGGYVARVGQQTDFPGENLQAGVGNVPSALGDGDFEISFDATGITLEVLGSSVFQAYQDTARGTTDFTNGAYAFAGSFFNREGGETTFDLTFSGPELAAVPEPAALALLGLGLACLGALRRRR